MANLFIFVGCLFAVFIHDTMALTCYTGFGMPSLGFHLNTTECDPGQICSYTTMEAYGMGVTSITVESGTCASREICESTTCAEMISSITAGVTVTSCKTACCDTDKCTENTDSVETTTPQTMNTNERLPETPKTHPRMVTAKHTPHTLECYFGVEMQTTGKLMSTKRCKVDEICSITAIEQASGKSSRIGDCLSRDACESAACDDIATEVKRYGGHVTSCEITCCETDLCTTAKTSRIINNPSIIQTTTSPVIAVSVVDATREVLVTDKNTSNKLQQTTSHLQATAASLHDENTTSGGVGRTSSTTFASVIIIFTSLFLFH